MLTTTTMMASPPPAYSLLPPDTTDARARWRLTSALAVSIVIVLLMGGLVGLVLL